MPQYQTVAKIRSVDLKRLFPGGLDRMRRGDIPQFMRTAGIEDFKSSGFRLVVDVPAFYPSMDTRSEQLATVHMFSGKFTPNLSPQDWMTPKPAVWDPGAEIKFYDLCIEAARRGASNMQFGNTMYYPGGRNVSVFGVSDGDPKAGTHFLMLAEKRSATMADDNFNYGDLYDFFSGAHQILSGLSIADQKTRYAVNFGLGYQAMPRVHMHVMSFAGYMPKILPQDYGFTVSEDGSVTSPEESPIHQQILDIIEKRRDIAGFDDEARQERKTLDLEIMSQLRALPV